MIARHCGMSDPAIHYHFRSKSDIYDALLVAPEYGSPAPQGAANRRAIADFMEQRFWWWARDAEFIRLLLREQLHGRPESINYLVNSEQQYRAELEQVAQAVYGERARTIADLAWYLLAGALWDVVLAYGSEAPDIIEQDYFRMRVRRLIDTALDAVNPCQP
jgi:AcrR family transcriptional regulator